MMRLLALGLLVSLTFIKIATAHDFASRATYIGNAGIMVERGDSKILFDAFYANSYGQYALVPDEINNAMFAGEVPYDGIDAVFISHVHGDHFTAEPAIAFLRKQENVQLYGSSQVVEAIINAGVDEIDPLMKRIHGFDLSPQDNGEQFSVGSLNVDVVAIPHAGNRPTIQNFAWRVTLDGQTTVLHLGDAGTVRADFEQHREHFSSKKTDAAFPPYWFIGNDKGDAILTEIIAPIHAVGIHVPARAAGHGDEWRANAGGDLFTDPGETRDISED